MVARAGLRGRARDVAALVLVAALAGAVVVAALAGARRTTSSFDRLQDRSGAPDLDVELAEPADPSVVDDIAAIDGVRGVVLASYVAAAPEESELVPFESTIGFAVVGHAGDGGIDELVVEGRTPDDDRVDEIMFNQAMADLVGAEVGDVVTLVAVSQEDGDAVFETGVGELRGDRVDATLVGIVAGAEDIADAPDPVTVVTPAYTEEHDVYSVPLLLGVRVEPGRTAAVYEELVDRLPGASVSPSGEFRRRIQDGLDVQALGLVALAVAVGVAGVVAIWGAVIRLLAGAQHDDNAVGALGVTLRQRRCAAAARVAPAGLTAAVAAGVLGWLAAPLAISGLAAQTEQRRTWWLDVPVVVGIPLLVLLLVVGVAASSVRRGPLVGREGSTAMERAVLRSGLPPMVALGVRRVTRPRGTGVPALGGASSVGAVVAAVAAVAAVATFGAGVDHLLDTPATWGARFDATAYSGFDVDGLRQGADAASEDERIAAIAVVHELDATAYRPDGEPVIFPVNAVEAVSGAVPVEMIEGRLMTSDDEVVVGEWVLSSLDLQVGDDLELQTETGDHTYRIVGSAVTYTNDSIDDSVIVTGPAGADMVEELETGVVLASFASGVDREEGVSALAPHFGSVDPVEQPGSVDNLDELGSLPEVLAATVVALGIIALAAALVSSVRLRRRETALLRAVGATGAQVATPVVAHGATLAVLGGLVGIPLGVILGRMLLRVVTGGIGALFEPVVPVLPLLAVGVVTIAAALALTAPAAWLAIRQRPGASLQAE